MTQESSPVRSRTVDQTLVLELNRPERLNAVSLPLYEALIDALDLGGVEPHDSPHRAVVITGAGRAFCVGADLKAHGEGRPDAEVRRRYVNAAQAANRAIQRCRVPVIAAVNGHAIGAGLELALSADFMIVSEKAKLRLPEVALGTFIGGGVTYTLVARVGTRKAKELIMMGRFFSGRDAEEWGIANTSVAPESVLGAALEWSNELAKRAPVSLAWAKRLLTVDNDAMDRILDQEAAALLECMATEDWQEGVDAFAEGREPDFRGR